MISKILVLFTVMVLSSAACPQVDVMQNINLEKYMGKWLEDRRIKHDDFQKDGICVSATYTLNEAGYVDVLNRMKNSTTNKWLERAGKARPAANAGQDAKLEVSFDDFVHIGGYWVLDTDYDNFSVVYSCSPSPAGEDEYCWVLRREKSDISRGQLKERIDKILTKYNLDSKVTATQQDDCSQ